MANIDGIWPDNRLSAGSAPLARQQRRSLICTLSSQASSGQSPPRHTLGLAAFANDPRLVRSAWYAVLALLQEAPTAIRNIIARVERGFAAFAQIPHEDSLARRELLQLLDELEAAFPDVQFDNQSVDPERFVYCLKTTIPISTVRDGHARAQRRL